jgi:hypothetical protein
MLNSANSEKPFINRFACLIFYLNNVMNVLGWGTLLLMLFGNPIISIALPLLVVIVPLALIINLSFIVSYLVLVFKNKESIVRNIKVLPWRNLRFFGGCVSTILFYIGSFLFLFIMHQLMILMPTIDSSLNSATRG